ncbi:MAG: hypothetical protein AAB288_06130, partial [Acidobacteriota bacterium]
MVTAAEKAFKAAMAGDIDTTSKVSTKVNIKPVKMFESKKRGGGLEGVEAGQTAVCSVGHGGNNLMYRGYLIQDLV